MPFCPKCEAEYQAGISSCPSCETALVDHLERNESSEDTVDFYVCYERQLADRVLEMLREAGLDPLLRDRSSYAFPTTIGTGAQHSLAVPKHDLDKARQLLIDAIDDGVLSREDGELVA